MASSKVMPSSSTSTNSDLNSHHHHHHHHHHFLSPSSQMISDFTADLQPPSDSSNTLLDADISLIDAAGAIDGSIPAETKTVEDVWREIVAGKSNERVECKVEAAEELMTLEDFLAKAGAGMEGDEPEQEGMMVEEDVKLEVSAGIPMAGGGGVFGFDHQLVPASYSAGMGGVMGYGNGSGGGMGGSVRGKRRGGPILEPLDKAAQQRQRRMIKNRESAARSRERKQAYQVELESLALKLEEENEQLLREKAERSKARFKQLMEKVIPVVERRRPPRALRRVRSMEW